MNHLELNQELGNIDIYLLDQILKGNYSSGSHILDAGCGEGRNIHYFLKNGYVVSAVDENHMAVKMVRMISRQLNTHSESRVEEADLAQLPFADKNFDHVICIAVLHFARNTDHFQQMWGELVRVLKTGGTLFIRMASDFALPDPVADLGNGRFKLPNDREFYLLQRESLDNLLNRHNLQLLEPIKSVYVDQTRCMTTVVLKKQ